MVTSITCNLLIRIFCRQHIIKQLCLIMFQATLKISSLAIDMKRLVREIRVLKQLDHENVVRIYHTLVSSKRKNSSGSVSCDLGIFAIGLLFSNDSQPAFMGKYLPYELKKKGYKKNHCIYIIHLGTIIVNKGQT